MRRATQWVGANFIQWTVIFRARLQVGARRALRGRVVGARGHGARSAGAHRARRGRARRGEDGDRSRRAVDGRAAPRDRTRAGTRTGGTRATPACRRRSSGSCPRASPRGRSNGRRRTLLPAGRSLNYGYEGEVLHLVAADAPRRRLAPGATATLARARRLARLQGDLHSRRRRSHAHAARVDQRRVPIRDGAGRSPRRAPRCRNRSRAGRRARKGNGTTIALKLVAARGRGRSGRDALFRECDRPDRAVGAADARARRQRLRADAAGGGHAVAARSATSRACVTAANGFSATCARRRSTSPVDGAVTAGAKAGLPAAPALDSRAPPRPATA